MPTDYIVRNRLERLGIFINQPTPEPEGTTEGPSPSTLGAPPEGNGRQHAPPRRGRPPGSRNKVQRLPPARPPPQAPDPTVMAVRIPEAARRMSLSATMVKELVTTGRLKSLKVGAVRLIPVREIAAFLERSV